MLREWIKVKAKDQVESLGELRKEALLVQGGCVILEKGQEWMDIWIQDWSQELGVKDFDVRFSDEIA